jgi:hypothetical protein
MACSDQQSGTARLLISILFFFTFYIDIATTRRFFFLWLSGFLFIHIFARWKTIFHVTMFLPFFFALHTLACPIGTPFSFLQRLLGSGFLGDSYGTSLRRSVLGVGVRRGEESEKQTVSERGFGSDKYTKERGSSIDIVEHLRSTGQGASLSMSN